MLADDELKRGLDDLVRIGRYRASAALKMQRDRLVAVFEAMDDPVPEAAAAKTSTR